MEQNTNTHGAVTVPTDGLVAEDSLPDPLPEALPVAEASVADLAWSFRQELNTLRGRRFEWVERHQGKFVKDWKMSWQQFQEWENRVRTTIEKLRLAELPTGVGQETVCIVGSSDLSGCLSQQEVTEVNENDEAAPIISLESLPAALLAPATPLSMEVVEPTLLQTPQITLAEAIQRKQWMIYQRDRTAICITCPCPPMPIAVPSANQSTHYLLVPRYFHEDVLANDIALHHFEITHNKAFSDIEELIMHMGSQVVGHNGICTFDGWEIAAHNAAVTGWHEERLGEWQIRLSQLLAPASFADTGKSQGEDVVMRDADPEQRVLTTQDVNCASLRVFSWPETGDGGSPRVICCPFPQCTVPRTLRHGLTPAKAVEHFKTHGLHLTKTQVVREFGFKVAATYPLPTARKLKTPSQELDLGPLLSSTDFTQEVDMKELREACAVRGIEIDSRLRKHYIVSKLNDFEAQNSKRRNNQICDTEVRSVGSGSSES
ncbi:hypothetical protein F4678DRAFT_460738 [Xylaria arbuscula]|nr:hypothetical protein F4678DRAFT_460738 [Xylaria arbuscula]